MKKLAVILLALVLSLCAVSALAEGTLRVGMECNYPPFNWTQVEPSDFAVALESGGYADGYDVQIARKIAEGLGMELQIVKTEWDGLIPGVVSGITDAIIAGMSPTAERKASIDFTDAYYTSDLVLVVRKDGAYAAATSLKDFAGAKVTGQLSTVHYDKIAQIEGVNQMMAMESFPAMVVALQSGAIDAYVAERPGAMADTLANPDLTYIGFAEGDGFTATYEEKSIAVGVQMGSELTQKISEIISAISEEEREQMMLDAIKRQPLSE